MDIIYVYRRGELIGREYDLGTSGNPEWYCVWVNQEDMPGLRLGRFSGSVQRHTSPRARVEDMPDNA